jgi:hypothetical protein
MAAVKRQVPIGNAPKKRFGSAQVVWSGQFRKGRSNGAAGVCGGCGWAMGFQSVRAWLELEGVSKATDRDEQRQALFLNIALES